MNDLPISLQSDAMAEYLSTALTPVLCIDASAVAHNISTIIECCEKNPDRWRPHLKTTKCTRVWAMLADRGVTNCKCATVREAVTFLELMRKRDEEHIDLVVAYPHRLPAIRAIADAAAQCPASWSVSVLVEDHNLIDDIPSTLGLFIDLNPGMNRSGIPFNDRSRIDNVIRAAGQRLTGVHAYEGHLAHLEPAERTTVAESIYADLDALLNELYNAHDGWTPREVITSGTPAFLCALHSPTVSAWRERDITHRVSPGTVVFHDSRTNDDVPELRNRLRPATTLAARVVSQPAHNIITVDAGSKSIAAEAGAPCAIVLGNANLEARTPSEEHLPLRIIDSAQPAPVLGDVVHLFPKHVCPTVNLAEEAVWINGDGTLTTEHITARAHDISDVQ